MAEDQKDLLRPPIDELLQTLATMPVRPIGPHLPEKEIHQLVDETLSPDLSARAVTHIESCPRCADGALRAFERGVQVTTIPNTASPSTLPQVAIARRSLVSLEEYLDAKNRNQAAFGSTVLDQIQRAVGFNASSHTYHWRETLPDLGDVTVTLDDRREHRTITVDTTSDLNGRLVGCGLCGNVDVPPLFMVLHPSRIIPGHLRATARIDDSVTLPEPCFPNPYLSQRLPSAEQLVAAAHYAHTRADYDALLAWMRLKTGEGLVSEDVLAGVPLREGH